MGFHKYPYIEDYWKTNVLYECAIQKVFHTEKTEIDNERNI